MGSILSVAGNKYLSNENWVQKWVTTMKKNTLDSWHSETMNEDQITKQIHSRRMNRLRKKGRPKKLKWRNCNWNAEKWRVKSQRKAMYEAAYRQIKNKGKKAQSEENWYKLVLLWFLFLSFSIACFNFFGLLFLIPFCIW